MLRIEVPISPEGWDKVKREFVDPKVQVLHLEHSLVSLSKWEMKWKKPFLSETEKTREETVDYIKCMTITQNVDPSVYLHLTERNIDDVNEYMGSPMTATWFSDDGKKKKKPGNRVITNELIYYWMMSLGIPMECQKWHLNRLFTLIQVHDAENNTSNKKMSKKETFNRNNMLNEARKKKFNTKG